MLDCKFCNKFQTTSEWTLNNNTYDTLILETKNFIVVPTMGSLLEGWCLIISKFHVISTGALNDSFFTELNELIKHVKCSLNDLNKDVFVFEHGPSQPNQIVGCGIDHLHIHMVPVDFNLFEKSKLYTPFNWVKVGCLTDTKNFFSQQLPYLYIQLPNEERYITTHQRIPNQFFRRVIASELGIADKYDWKLDYGTENIKKTLSVFSENLQLV